MAVAESVFCYPGTKEKEPPKRRELINIATTGPRRRTAATAVRRSTPARRFAARAIGPSRTK